MSRIAEVIKSKRKITKELEERKRNEVVNLRKMTSYKARSLDALKGIDILLEDENIEKVVIEIPNNQMTEFSAMLYSNELSGYEIVQVDGVANRFYIGKKYIRF